jgi:hypothetical protein
MFFPAPMNIIILEIFFQKYVEHKNSVEMPPEPGEHK